MGHLSGEYLYEIFARQKREDRLEHIGTVSAPNPALARAYAWQTYDEQKWFEMVVAPREAFEAVNRNEEPFTLSPAEAR